ncbi:nucleoside phosphorylase domain-containing protein [Aspergillus bertholletiae]|uniref:Nucleoside phosphorylase domain-containing protein n=1 Tax=Aspergillus bertholletiae TaxID=1226010 RepID=A0A5N7B0Y8_9EURO|nr:nucleoside phosphorylase domain-containing protein [Aspergillus bertholletiae]
MVGWIYALPIERAAAECILDEKHESPTHLHPSDHNQYVLGNIGPHNVAITCLPAGTHGTTSAAAVSQQMLSGFPNIRFGLVVGIGGGIPSADRDIRLGDVVISQPGGKALHGGQFEWTGKLDAPPPILLNALSTVQSKHLGKGIKFRNYLDEFTQKYPQFSPPGQHQHQDQDVLYASPDGGDGGGGEKETIVSRPARAGSRPVAHYGLVASGNQVIKAASMRDKLKGDLGDVFCVEMEAAGLMNNFPCLVIRGISDYANHHKND